jgi:type IV secretion system protein VirB11
MTASPRRVGGVYLQSYLGPLQSWLLRPDVTDILINRPGEVWIEALGQNMVRCPAPGLTDTVLHRLATQVAAIGHQGINRENPILSASLPSGERVQVVLPPATRDHIAFAIRKQVRSELALADYAAAGAFDDTITGGEYEIDQADRELDHLLAQRRLHAFFELAVTARKNILISGGTSTGKTTFLNALVREIPSHERLIVIEDAAEIEIRQQNAVGLLAVKGALGEAKVGPGDLVQAALRMRPDRILVGELRGSEAFSFLRAVNTGHPGSITSVHADTPEGAFEQIALMVMQAHANIGREETVAYARRVVDIVVQLARRDGRRVVAEVRRIR